MPTYEYRCPDGHLFELFQKMSEEPRAKCPECGAESERLLSGGAGFLFKGEGFYITDSRSASYKKSASDEKSAGMIDKADSSGGGDSKKAPDTKKASDTKKKPGDSSSGSGSSGNGGSTPKGS